MALTTDSVTHSPALPDWRALASCRDTAPDLFFPVGSTGLAVEQIELLLGMQNQPGVKRVEWLTLIAGWQLQLLGDEAAAMDTLTKIVSDFPSTPQAFAAQRRLNLIKADIAARKT